MIYIKEDLEKELNIKSYGDITIALDFWECDCDEDYIHTNYESQCQGECGFYRDEMPNARFEELCEYPEIITRFLKERETIGLIATDI